MLASSQLTSSPSIQIFSVFCSGMVSDPPGEVVADVGSGTSELGGGRLRHSFVDAGGGIAGAKELEHEGDRGDGRQRVGPVLAGLRFADAARPMPPDTAPPRSVRMSPNRLSVTMTSKRSGASTK